jgi:hypothetical protein
MKKVEKNSAIRGLLLENLVCSHLQKNRRNPIVISTTGTILRFVVGLKPKIHTFVIFMQSDLFPSCDCQITSAMCNVLCRILLATVYN